MRTKLSLFGLALCTQLHALTVDIWVQQQPVCSYANGSVYASATGSVPPYTYQWNTGSTQGQITGLMAGNYSVLVTDANGEEATAEITLEALSGWGNVGMGSHPYCDGQSSYGHMAASYLLAGDPFSLDLSSAFPLTFDGSFIEVYNTNTAPAWLGYSYIFSAPPGQHVIGFTDANGCPGTAEGTIYGPVEWPTFAQVDAAASCGPMPNGSITVLRTGGNFAALTGPFETIWDTGTPDPEVFYEVPPGGHWLVQTTRTPAANSVNWEVLPASQCGDSIYVVVPDAGPDCGELSGTVYIDADENCAQDGGEIAAGYQVLLVEPGPRYVSTDFNGNYTANVPLGTYTVAPANDQLLATCPVEATVASLAIPVELDVPLVGTAGPAPDLYASLVSGPARPGFELIYSLHANNINYGATGAVTATFTADAITSIISAEPTPDLITGQTVIWNLPEVAPYNWSWLQVRVQVPADVALIGTMLSAGWSLASAELDLNPANNSATLNTLVTGSYDPNDKRATTSTRASEELYFIDQDEWIDYVIRFQNTGTDTAFNVLISDTLPSTLDPATLRVGAGSHPFTWELAHGNVLRFHFDDILLPDSNVNEPRSHGQVTFRMAPRAPLAPGTTIQNIANIYFDYNPPVITEPSVLVAEFSTGLSVSVQEGLHVAPNPAADRLFYRIPAALTGPYELEIVAMDGRVIQQVNSAVRQQEIGVGRLSAGNYMIRARSRAGTTHQARFIKE